GHPAHGREVCVTTVPVVIVGAGPTGITAATLLAQYGVDCLVLDRWANVYPQPRAVHLDDEIYRVVARLGISDEFAAISRPAQGLRLLDPTMRVLAEFRRDTALSEHGFPQANMFDQPELEALLRTNLKRYSSAELRGNVEVTAVEETSDGRIRVAFVDGTDNSEHDVHADFVLGCDAATDADLDQWDGVHQVCNPARAGTYMRIGSTRYRWEFRLLPDESADDFGSLQALKPLITPWTSRVGDDELELVRVTEYTFRAQTADRWRRGNIFLLGDAAHLTPPFIGHGMGAGMRDAMNLAWKVAGVISGDLPRAALDSYEQERKPHTRHMIRLALTVGWAMTAGGELGNLIRSLVVTRMKFVPGLRSKVIDSRTPALHRSAFVHRRHARRQLAGTLCPNPVLADGCRLDRVLGDGFALITAVPPDDTQHRLLNERGAVVHIAAPDGELADWLRCARVASAIVRPDRTVMWAGRDLRRMCDLLPSFRPEKKIRSNV